ncbi:MAG TPA: PDZ domain-containing protein [Croceibacterium sp.]|nr:PDZ domain-containing protein [Croceibacterium sp.]
MDASPRPSTAVLLAVLAVVVAGALLLNPAPLRHRHNQLSGLTYEIRPASHRGPVTLIVTSVADEGAAARVGITAGDVIDRIDHRPIPSPAAIAVAARHDGNRGILLRIRHGGENRYTYLPVERGTGLGAAHVAENTRRRG